MDIKKYQEDAGEDCGELMIGGLFKMGIFVAMTIAVAGMLGGKVRGPRRMAYQEASRCCLLNLRRNQ